MLWCHELWFEARHSHALSDATHPVISSQKLHTQPSLELQGEICVTAVVAEKEPRH